MANQYSSKSSQTNNNLKVAKALWTTHFLLTTAVVLMGVLYNGGNSKYIPANLAVKCHKAFVNILAKSQEEDGATICCDGFNDSALCRTSYPLLYKQLTHLPGAWLVPLLPFLLRQITVTLEALDTGLPTESMRASLRRLLFYIFVFMVRGFVLFLGANVLEDMLVKTGPDICWYSDLQRGTSICHGLQFDFSDHTVLYFGQILPISLMECIHIFVTHRWNKNWKFALLVLFCYLPYLYYITLFGEFSTAAYFHTGSEMLVGYFVSLLIQLPIAYLQCSEGWKSLKEALFGTFSGKPNND